MIRTYTNIIRRKSIAVNFIWKGLNPLNIHLTAHNNNYVPLEIL